MMAACAQDLLKLIGKGKVHSKGDGRRQQQSLHITQEKIVLCGMIVAQVVRKGRDAMQFGFKRV